MTDDSGAMKRLQQLLAKEDAVVFVGSGLSRWAGLPSWEGLIESLAKFLEDQGVDPSLVRAEAQDGDLLQAASYGVAKLSLAQFGDFVRSSCRSGKVEPVEIHKALMNLGPSCFITTNYDDLIEQAFRLWRRDPSEPRITLNRQPVDQADIVKAKARDFVFKPHGDARDTESIVLTREQYRALLPEGSFSATLPTLMSILSSRPVLFVGFGLRDPDFLHVRDLLANIYRGGLRDHYAIVADPVADQINWWRDTYGVHLIGYHTVEKELGGSDHTALLELLLAAGGASALPTSERLFDRADPAFVLELARYGAGNVTPEKIQSFDIRVSGRTENYGANRYWARDIYEQWPVARLLLEGPPRLVLTGAPGAGKSFAIRQAVNALATTLQDACLQGELDDRLTVVPLFIDLKLYEGDLSALIDARFPPKLNFANLNAAFPLTLFLDGFNELPRQHREDGSFDLDLDNLLAKYPNIRLIIGSRTSDGLTRLEPPIYELSSIANEEVHRLISEREYLIPSAYRRDIEAILRRPFYFRLFEQTTISIERVKTPSDIYAQYLDHIGRRFVARFGKDFDLLEALERQAYDALETGSEAWSLADLKASLRSLAPDLTSDFADEIVNWMAAIELVIPQGAGRGTFVHQSVTEYLAARKLAARLMANDTSIPEIIARRRWDNVILLTLSMLGAEQARMLLAEIIEIDPGFAIDGARFVEEKREELIEALLQILIAHPERPLERYNSNLSFLQFSPSHEGLLRQIVAEFPAIRPDAEEALAGLLGQAFKPELVEKLFADHISWETRPSVEALSSLLTPDDVPTIIDRALKWDPSSLDDEDGETYQRVSTLSSALSDMPMATIRSQIFARIAEVDPPQKRILAALLADILMEEKSTEGVEMLIVLATEGLLSHLFSLYLCTMHEGTTRQHLINRFDEPLLNTIVGHIDNGDRWALDLIKNCCANSPEIAEMVSRKAELEPESVGKMLCYCKNGDDSSIFEWLEHICVLPINSSLGSELNALELSDLNWNGRNDLLVRLLGRRDPELTLRLLGGSIPVEMNGLEAVDLGDPKPWIDWLLELVHTVNSESDRPVDRLEWLTSQLAFLIARSSAPDSDARLIALLDKGDPNVQWAIGHMIMPYMEGLSISELPPSAIEFLLKLLGTQSYHDFRPHIFSYIATEAFVRARLFPLAATGDAKVRENIAGIFREVGKKLGIRFALPPTETA